jgi:hypothetical protein
VTTSIRVIGPDVVTIRARKPIRPPTDSDKELAMRSAAARAAIRRGSSTKIFRSRSQVSFINASGTRVVFPAPGGATSTAAAQVAKAARSSSRTPSIGSGWPHIMWLYLAAKCFATEAWLLGAQNAWSSGTPVLRGQNALRRAGSTRGKIPPYESVRRR